MTDYTATPDTWDAALKYARSERAPSALPATICVLELRSRIETLEVVLDRLRIDHLQLANATAKLAPDRAKFFAYLLPEHDVDVDAGAAEAAGITNPTSNLNQIRSSLVERLRDALATEDDPADYCWDEARVVLREVATWIEENHGNFQAIALVLKKEADND